MMLPGFESLQHDLHRFLRTRLTDSEAPVPTTLAAQYVAPPNSPSIETRLGVYSDAYAIRLVDSLAEDYPTIRALLGESDFDELAREYLVQFPPQSPLLIEASSRFPEFLLGQSLQKNKPYLRDLATLEWKVIQSRYADPVPYAGLSPDELLDIDWGAVRLWISPSVHWCASEWSLCRTWHTRHLESPEPPIQNPQNLLIDHVGSKVRVQEISKLELVFLNEVHLGRNLREASEALCQNSESESDCDLQGTLASWIAQKVICF